MKFTKLFVILMIIIVATSCILKRGPLYYKTSYEYANEIGPRIITCLLERDRDGLKDLFCSKVRNT